MAFNTRNPIGSRDPRDLYDNATNLDNLVNGPQPFYPDRLNVQRLSWRGMQEQFTSAQTGRAAQFQQFLSNSGFEAPFSYAAGQTLERVTQTFVRDNVQYRIKDPADLPYTLTGNWASESDNFVSMGDSSLRQDLAGPTGASRVGFESGSLADFIRFGVGRTVTSIEELRALEAGDNARAMVLGYRTPGDGGGGFYYADANDTTSTEDGGAVIIGADGTRWKLRVEGSVSIRSFGATGVDSDFQDAAIEAFFAYLIRSQKVGFVPAGSYRHSSRVVLDMVTAPGVGSIKLKGEGPYVSTFTASATTGIGFHIKKSGANNSDGQRVHTFGLIEDVGFYADTTGEAFTIGGSDLVDTAGNYYLKNAFFCNINSQNVPCVALKLNYVFDCLFENIVAINKVGYGDALNCRQCHFGTFIGGSYSNGANGVVFNGFSHSNTFIGPDLENIGVGILNVTAQDQNNIFINPFFDIYNPVTGVSNGFAVRSLDCGPGGLILDSPYTQQRAGNYVVDPSNQKNLFIRGTVREPVTTPAFPASDTAVTNNTGRNILVRFSNLSGTLTSVFINGEQTPMTGGAIVLLPRQTIAPRYTGTAPVWRWDPMV